jgi:4-amino-4-deoxy-L-arabinose transferase-like glycosyltransferase
VQDHRIEDQPSLGRSEKSLRLRGTLGILLLVGLYAAAIYLPFLGSGRILTRHEVLVTHPALNMVESGNWLVPYYTGSPWLDKPPLIPWITATLYSVAGFGEFVARLPSALSAIGLCVLIAALSTRFLDMRGALLAGLAQATCIYMYMQGRLGELDMPFALFLGGAHAVLALHWGKGHVDLPFKHAMAFHTLAGLAVMTKGPLALGLLCFTVLAFCIFRRSYKPLLAVLFTPAVLCFVLVGLSWYFAVTYYYPDLAVEAWWYTNIDRFTGEHHLGVQNPFLYFYTIPWLTLPWSVVLAIGARRLFNEARQKDAYFDRFLWAWFFGGLILLSLSAFKHKHYCIPILPPLSIFTARLLSQHAVEVGRRAERAYLGFFIGILIVFGVVGAVIMPMRDHRVPTVEFLRTYVPQVPEDEKLYVIGLGQVSAYPYIDHQCAYVNSFSELEKVIRKRDGQPLWALTLRMHLRLADNHGLAYEKIAAEPAREKHPRHKTLTLARLSPMQPVSSTTRPSTKMAE